MKDEKEEGSECQCDSCTGKLKETLTPKEREELGQTLTDLVNKYTGIKRGVIQAVSIGTRVNEPVMITVDILL